jgi:hypothetical protein
MLGWHWRTTCNRETHTLHIDATFRSFMQGDLSVDITDRVLVLNILRGLNKNFEHLHTIFMHATPFLSFKKVLDDLCLEEI